ncbi:MAG: hypothetical protein HN736_09355 [Anaerolineae bacterium]|nr:hypothetical protein [Anaerolineae bacterium]MBT4310740.1 hypothetical protein [Anaerolineae bacterium]MBT4456828.1 hypothetical protein [Anaerolineae bacterium]MBT4841704.1 hypothetical protein [Anaerolineae bacterium]MBT6062928.1 hypothetical protein [Anaerolineae bacterium]
MTSTCMPPITFSWRGRDTVYAEKMLGSSTQAQIKSDAASHPPTIFLQTKLATK